MCVQAFVFVSRVGKHISTKKKGAMKGRINTTSDKDDEDREDVTSLYKYKEGKPSFTPWGGTFGLEELVFV